jgi:virulence factor
LDTGEATEHFERSIDGNRTPLSRGPLGQHSNLTRSAVLKIGVIGLGDIAQKAYLPVLCSKKIDIHLHTRTEDTLARIAGSYRIHNVHQDLESLIQSGIQGALVHAPTSVHYEIVEQLLQHNIHVYVDKPITYDYVTSEKLIALARERNVSLTVGFNRRFAPSYLRAKALGEPNMVVLQKNRNALPAEVRKFIFDDFIHVVDTLLLLFPYAIETMTIQGKKKGDLLSHVVLQLIAGSGAIAIGIMNRDSGTTEERLEVYTSEEKCVVHNVSEVVIQHDKQETKPGINDWETTLHKRGFEQIITSFLNTVESGRSPEGSDQHTLRTHKVCEEIVQKLTALPR